MKFVYSLLVGCKALERRQCRIRDMLQKLYDVGGVDGEFKILGEEVEFHYGRDMMRFAMIEFSRDSGEDELDYAIRRDRGDIERGLRMQLDSELEDALDNSGQNHDMILGYVQGPIWDSGHERGRVLAFAAEMRKPYQLHQRLQKAIKLLEQAAYYVTILPQTVKLRDDVEIFLNEEKKRDVSAKARKAESGGDELSEESADALQGSEDPAG